MKRAALIFGVLFLVLTVLACDFAGINVDLGGGADEPPASQPQIAPVEAGIDAPSSGTVLQMGPVDIAYHASSLEGVSVVELSIDGAVVSSIASPDSSTKVVALRYTWNPPSAGSHTLQVRAQNKSGAWSNLVTSAITIQGAQPTRCSQQQQAPQAPTPLNQPKNLNQPPRPTR